MRHSLISVQRLAAATDDELARILTELFKGDPAAAYDALAPALDPPWAASPAGSALAAEVLTWLAGDSAGARQSIDARIQRARSRQSQTDRYESLELAAQSDAKRHWQGEPRWKAVVLRLAKAGTLSTDPLWRLTGLATLELSEDEAWSVLDPVLTPSVLTKRNGAEFALESLLSNPSAVAPDLEHRYWTRITSSRTAGRLAELARTGLLRSAAERLLLQAFDWALRADGGQAFEAADAVMAKGGPLAGSLLDHLFHNPLAEAAMTRDPRWLELLSAHKRNLRSGVADTIIEGTLARVLALSPSQSFDILAPIANIDAPLLSAVTGLGHEAIVQLSEAEPRWAIRLLAIAAKSKLASEVPVHSLLAGLFAHAHTDAFEALSPFLVPAAGRRQSALASEVALFIDVGLSGSGEQTGRHVRDHLEREPRWLDIVLSWAESGESFERALQLLVQNSTLTDEELFAKLERFVPARALKEKEAERADDVLRALVHEPRLDHPLFLDRFAACLAENPKRAWILELASARLVARGDTRVVPILLAMLSGNNIPTTLPAMLQEIRDPRIPPAIAALLPRMPRDLLSPLHDVLRAHGDPSVISALEKLSARSTGKSATLANETIRALRPAGPGHA